MHFSIGLLLVALLSSIITANQNQSPWAKRMSLPCPDCHLRETQCPEGMEPVVLKIFTFDETVKYPVPVDEDCPQNTVITCGTGKNTGSAASREHD